MDIKKKKKKSTYFIFSSGKGTDFMECPSNCMTTTLKNTQKTLLTA